MLVDRAWYLIVRKHTKLVDGNEKTEKPIDPLIFVWRWIKAMKFFVSMRSN